MKLRTKLTLLTTLIVSVAVLISTVIITGFAAQYLKDNIITAGIEDFTLFYDSFSQNAGIRQTNAKVTPLQSDLRFIFYNTPGSGEYVLQNEEEVISNNTGIDALKILNSGRITIAEPAMFKAPLQYLFSGVGQRDYFIASAVIVIDGTEYRLSLARDVTEPMDSINTIALKCAAAGFLVIIASSVLALLLSSRSLKPVETLEKGANEIAGGNYEHRIDITGRDEIAVLGKRFNEMAGAVSSKIDELNETAKRRQAFINGLSHEMKTPVTSIMARSETLLVRDISEEDKRRSLERIYGQCAWLERLTQKLMTLTMLDGGIERKTESVAELFESVKETEGPSLDEMGIWLITDCRMDTLCMDVDLMRSALVNLVENSKRASARGAAIELSAYGNVIEVKDHGKGIPKDEIAMVTEPFYMVDRSRSKKNGGSGLGLALVKRIAEAHGAELEITLTPGGGTTVRLIFAIINN